MQVIAHGNAIGEELLAFGFDFFTTGTAFEYKGYTLESGFDDYSL